MESSYRKKRVPSTGIWWTDREIDGIFSYEELTVGGTYFLSIGVDYRSAAASDMHAESLSDVREIEQ